MATRVAKSKDVPSYIDSSVLAVQDIIDNLPREEAKKVLKQATPKAKTKPKPKTKPKAKLQYRLIVWDRYDTYLKTPQYIEFPTKAEAIVAFRHFELSGDINAASIRYDGFEIMRWDGSAPKDKQLEYFEIPPVERPFRLSYWLKRDIYHKHGKGIDFETKNEAFSAFKDLWRSGNIIGAIIREDGLEIMFWDAMSEDAEVEWVVHPWEKKQAPSEVQVAS